MKKATLFLIAMICLGLAGCNSDAELKAFHNEKSDLLVKMASTIDANPTAAGVAEAQKLFDAKKTDLKAKSDAVKKSKTSSDGDLLGYKAEAFDTNILLGLSTKHAAKLAGDPEFKTAFNKLTDDFINTFK